MAHFKNAIIKVTITRVAKLYYIKDLVKFSLPIIAGQIGQMLFGIGDLVIAGRYSTEVVSALGIAGSLVSPFLLVGLGITFALSPLASQEVGQKTKSPTLLFTSTFVSTIAGLLVTGPLLILRTQLDFLGLSPHIQELVSSYILICAPSIIMALVFQTAKEYLQAYDETYFANFLILLFNAINIGLNIVLMFGFLGLPELGIEGAALATLLTKSLMAIILWVYTYCKHPGTFSFHSQHAKDLLSLGLPISASILVEVMMFTTITVLAGTMGVLISAAHNIALHLASLTFMVPLGLSSACTVRIAQQWGKKDYEKLHQYALAGLQTGAGFMGLSAAAYLFYPEVLARLMSDEPELIAASATLLFYVALFQLSDGIQVVFMGILRGLGVTKRPTLLAFIGNWVLGIPLGIYLAYEQNMMAKGLWLGLAVGLSFMALSLGVLYHKVRPRAAFKA